MAKKRKTRAPRRAVRKKASRKARRAVGGRRPARKAARRSVFAIIFGAGRRSAAKRPVKKPAKEAARKARRSPARGRRGLFSGLFSRRAKRPVPPQFLKARMKDVVKELVASDIMTRKVVSIRDKDTLDYVVRLFDDKKISGSPVVNRNGNLVGTLSETDVTQYVGAKDLIDAKVNRLDMMKDTKMEEIMKRNTITVYEHTPIHEINYVMNKHDIARVFVVDNKRQVIGIVTRADMVDGIAKEMMTKIAQRPRQFEKTQVGTEIDEILESVDSKGSVPVSDIAKRLNMSDDKAEEWGRILERHGLVDMVYPPVGRPVLKRKEKNAGE